MASLAFIQSRKPAAIRAPSARVPAAEAVRGAVMLEGSSLHQLRAGG